MRKQAAAAVTPVRQRSQFSCMSCSMMMCIKAHGVDTNEDQVNRVMGAVPMQGASWENALACAQHYGFRATLVVPATLKQVKAWTDAGVPVMIAWNPEGRDWSHASVIFDVDNDFNVSVADPNIPDPDETVRVVPKEEFYKRWFEKWPSFLVRRPAMAVEREITPEGRQVVARWKTVGADNFRMASNMKDPVFKAAIDRAVSLLNYMDEGAVAKQLMKDNKLFSGDAFQAVKAARILYKDRENSTNRRSAGEYDSDLSLSPGQRIWADVLHRFWVTHRRENYILHRLNDVALGKELSPADQAKIIRLINQHNNFGTDYVEDVALLRANRPTPKTASELEILWGPLVGEQD